MSETLEILSTLSEEQKSAMVDYIKFSKEKLKQAYDELMEELKKERECVDFYASKENYYWNEENYSFSNLHDSDSWLDKDDGINYFGGRKARETQIARQAITEAKELEE